VDKSDAILDVGCGGGRTVHRLAEMALLGKVYGVDYSEASVAASQSLNRTSLESGRVVIQKASVSHLPFPDDSFDLVTAVETQYYWPDRPRDLCEIHRVLKPGGTVLMIAEVYRQRFDLIYRLVMRLLGGTLVTPEEQRNWLVNAGLVDVQIFLEPRGWICAKGRKGTG
jgi:ubiquinone/menaquinone biosynthesis C-methylase UbiE